MTVIVVAVHPDGALAERLTDETATPQHETYGTDGVTLLSTVDASEVERQLLFAATPKAITRPLSGSGPPANSVGTNGDTYIVSYGPKAGGVWPVGVTVELARRKP